MITFVIEDRPSATVAKAAVRIDEDGDLALVINGADVLYIDNETGQLVLRQLGLVDITALRIAGISIVSHSIEIA